ncbi:hypothetical protein FB451DRAFT_1196076 [Mycena latifolia]|nr:hypothetical protein FB451DRAFT_1196076 [Mycena latifolia]
MSHQNEEDHLTCHLDQMIDFEWKCLVEFNLRVDAEPAWTSGTLTNLECLFLVDYHPSFLLPSLRRVYFHKNIALSAEGFLERHGNKLTQLMLAASEPGTISVLDACLTLPLLICSSIEHVRKNLPSIKLFSPREPHLSLEKIILEAFFNSSHKETLKEEKGMRKFLGALDTEILPSLREIQIYNFYWPTTEREIAKSFLVDCAEELLEKNLRLTDMSGKHWTPRLKTVGKR